MFGLGMSTLGITLTFIALGIIILTAIVLRLMPRRRPIKPTSDTPTGIQADIPASLNAVLMVQPGGRVVYINQTAREWFNLSEDEAPNLERMARIARPSEAFLSLCATAGHIRFNLGQALVEGVSYAIPYEDQQSVLVTLERPQLIGMEEGESNLSSQAMMIFTEISQEMSASLDLPTTITTILESVDRLIPSDFSEIGLWSVEDQFFIPHRYLVNEKGVRRLVIAEERYKMEDGFTGYIASGGQPLLVEDVTEFFAARPAVSRQQFPMRSYLGIPLKMGSNLIGTIELASQAPGAFNDGDQEVLELLAGHAAVALQNAVIHSQERLRASEMAGLAELSQLSGSTREFEEVYPRLVESLAPLLGVGVLGFLIYDETTRKLDGKVPFLGMPEQFAEMYQSEIAEGSPAETLWEEGDVIITDDMSDTSPVGLLGLNGLAIAAGIRETVLMPLTSGGRSLGYLQTADKLDGSSFNDGDLRLLRIIAGQVAPIIENAQLMEQSRLRTQRSETLRRVASLAASGATADEVLNFSVTEISRFLDVDHAALLLFDETVGKLQLHQESIFGFSPDDAEAFGRFLINEADVFETVSNRATALISNHLPEDSELPKTYQGLQDYMSEIQAVLIVPLVVRSRGIGEIILGSKQADFFDANDLQTVSTVASQMAGAIERSKLLTQTDEGLQRRVDQMMTVTRISRELNTTLNVSQLLQQVYDELIRITGAEGGSILLFGTSDGKPLFNQIAMQIGKMTETTLSELDHRVLADGDPIIVEDFAHSAYNVGSSDIRSAMVVPIAQDNNVVGLIRLMARQPGHFDQVAAEVTQTLAAQAAIAISNVTRYQEQVDHNASLSRQVGTLSRLLETTEAIYPETPLDVSLAMIAQGVQETSLFDIVLFYLYDSTFKVIKPVAAAGLPPGEVEKMAEKAHLWEYIEQLIQPEFRRSNSYFIPYDQKTDIPSLLPEDALFSLTITETGDDPWEAGDRLIIPLQNREEEPLGVLVLDAPRTGLRPDDLSIETVEAFADKASLIIESHQQIEGMHAKMEDIQSEISRTGMAAAGDQGHLAILLQKDLEQTIAVQQLYDRARNIRVGLDIAETVNRQPDRQSVLTSLATQMLMEMELDIALVAEPSVGGPRLMDQFGQLPPGANPQALLGQRNPLRHTMLTGETLFVANLEESIEWGNSQLLRSLNAKAFIALPIAANGQVEAAVLATSNAPLPNMTREDEQIYGLISSQVSITLQNLNLLTETRHRLREVNLLLDFSHQLGTLDPQEIVQTLVSSIRRVMPNAHGVLVAMWDEPLQALITQVAAGYSDNEMIREITHKPGQTILGKAYRDGETLNIKEVDFATQYNLTPEDLLKYREATGGRLPASTLVVPVKAGGITLGVVTLDNFNTTSAFSDDEIALLESLTQQTALTLENARLFEESRRLNEELEQRVTERTEELAREHQTTQTILNISTELSSSLDLDMVLNRSLEMLNEVTGAEHSTIVIIRPPEEHLVYRAGAGIHKPPPIGGRISALKIGQGLAGWVIQNREGVLVPDLVLDERWQKDHSETTVYRSAIAVPLIVGTDALGSLLLYHRQPGHFREDQIDAAQVAANQFAVTINNGELFRLIRDQAEDLGNILRTQQVEASRSTAMLEGVADGVLVTDSDGVISLFNDAAEEMLLLTREQVLGKSLDNFLGLFGGVAQAWTSTIRNWSNETNQEIMGETYSEQITLEDGRVLSVHLAPVSDRSEFLGTVSIFRDITHQVEVDRLKSEFVATVSHELRTPMTPIKGYVEFLLMGGAGELNEQQTEFVTIIKSNIDRLSILVNDLLDVSRIEAGKVTLSFQPIDLMEIVSDIQQSMQQKSEEDQRPVSFVIKAPKLLPSVYGDMERIRQIFSNLIDNAYNFSPENSTVIFKVTELGDDVQVDIIDQGIGIFPDEHERVFERFFRGENQLVMETAGTGLGLPIVKELVELHKGRIWVASSGVPGKGSIFSFTLPIYKPEEEPDTQPIKDGPWPKS